MKLKIFNIENYKSIKNILAVNWFCYRYGETCCKRKGETESIIAATRFMCTPEIKPVKISITLVKFINACEHFQVVRV